MPELELLKLMARALAIEIPEGIHASLSIHNVESAVFDEAYEVYKGHVEYKGGSARSGRSFTVFKEGRRVAVFEESEASEKW